MNVYIIQIANSGRTGSYYKNHTKILCSTLGRSVSVKSIVNPLITFFYSSNIELLQRLHISRVAHKANYEICTCRGVEHEVDFHIISGLSYLLSSSYSGSIDSRNQLKRVISFVFFCIGDCGFRCRSIDNPACRSLSYSTVFEIFGKRKSGRST